MTDQEYTSSYLDKFATNNVKGHEKVLSNMAEDLLIAGFSSIDLNDIILDFHDTIVLEKDAQIGNWDGQNMEVVIDALVHCCNSIQSPSIHVHILYPTSNFDLQAFFEQYQLTSLGGGYDIKFHIIRAMSDSLTIRCFYK